jgi:hypothetical protein
MASGESSCGDSSLMWDSSVSYGSRVRPAGKPYIACT